MITFSLTFSGLSSSLTVAHLHFAPTKVAGGVMIFLCGGGGQPDCPAATEGTITGTITAANVTGPTTQGINVGDLDSALEAVRDGLSYANMHTTKFPSGEIRGQVRRGAGHVAVANNLRESGKVLRALRPFPRESVRLLPGMIRLQPKRKLAWNCSKPAR